MEPKAPKHFLSSMAADQKAEEKAWEAQVNHYATAGDEKPAGGGAAAAAPTNTLFSLLERKKANLLEHNNFHGSQKLLFQELEKEVAVLGDIDFDAPSSTEAEILAAINLRPRLNQLDCQIEEARKVVGSERNAKLDKALAPTGISDRNLTEQEKRILAVSCLKDSDRLTKIKDILGEPPIKWGMKYLSLSLEEKANVDDQLKLIMTPEEYRIFVDESTSAGATWAARSLWTSMDGERSPIAVGPEIFAAKCKERAQLHCFIEGLFKRNAAPYDVSFMPNVPKVFDISEDGSCITDVRETDMIMTILTALQSVFLKGQDKEQEANPGFCVTFAASLGLIMKVLELNIQNSKTPKLKTYSQSEMKPMFEEIKSYFNIDVNYELQQTPASYARPRDYDGLNGCILSNIMAVLEKLAVIVKNIKLSMAMDDWRQTSIELSSAGIL
jgi:hypothetical protein